MTPSFAYRVFIMSGLKFSHFSRGDHTETVEVHYDPLKTDYAKMLEIFWKYHDPTSKCTRQYMSAIFYHDDEQKDMAERSMKVAQAAAARPIQTKILPAGKFYDAEDYHQKYILQQHAWLVDKLGLDTTSVEDMNNSHVAARLNGYIAGYGTMAKFEEELPSLGLSDEVVSYVRRQIASGRRYDC